MKLRVLSMHMGFIAFAVLVITFFMKTLLMPGMIEFGDMSYSLTLTSWLKWISIWDPITQTNNLQNLQLLPLETVLIHILIFMNYGVSSLQKIILLGSLYLSFLSMYLLLYSYLSKVYENRYIATFGALFGGLLYSVNPWILGALEEDTWIISYSIIPILFFLFDRAIHSSKEIKYSIAFALLSAFMLMQQFLVLFFSLVGMWIVFVCLTNKKTISRTLSRSFLAISLYAIFDSFFLIPIIGGSSAVTGVITTSNALIASSKSLNLFDQISFLGLLRLEGRFCCPPYPISFSNSLNHGVLWSIGTNLAFLIPILLAISLIFWYREVKILFMLSATVIFLFLATGTQNIVSGPYVWLISHIPLLGAFRESYLIVGIAAFPVAFLCGISVAWIIAKVGNRKNIISINNAKLIFTAILLLVILLISQYPVANAYANEYYNPTPIPSSYNDVISWLDSNAGSNTVIWIGQHYGALTFWGSNHPIGPFEVKSTYQPSLFGSSLIPGNFYYFILYALSHNLTSNIGKVLVPLNAKYVIFDGDTVGRAFPSINYSSVFVALEHQKDLHLSYHSGFLYVFENLENSNRFGLSDNIVLVAGGYDTIVSLANDPNFTFNYPVVMLDQQLLGKDTATIIQSNRTIIEGPEDNWYNLLVQTFNRSNFFPATQLTANEPNCWSVDSMYSIGDWHSSIESRLNDPFDFGYGLGAIWTSCIGASATSTLTLPKGNYDILARYLVSSTSGNMLLEISDSQYTLNAQSKNLTGMVWDNIGTFTSSGDKANISVTNLQGYNALNTLAFVPQAVFNKENTTMAQTLQNATIVKVQPKSQGQSTTTTRFPAMKETTVSAITNPSETRYTVGVVPSYYLQTSISYTPFWTLTGNKGACIPIAGYGVVNYYVLANCIKQLGHASLSFYPESQFVLGSFVSLISISVSILILFVYQYRLGIRHSKRT